MVQSHHGRGCPTSRHGMLAAHFLLEYNVSRFCLHPFFAVRFGEWWIIVTWDFWRFWLSVCIFSLLVCISKHFTLVATFETLSRNPVPTPPPPPPPPPRQETAELVRPEESDITVEEGLSPSSLFVHNRDYLVSRFEKDGEANIILASNKYPCFLRLILIFDSQGDISVLREYARGATIPGFHPLSNSCCKLLTALDKPVDLTLAVTHDFVIACLLRHCTGADKWPKPLEGCVISR